MKSKKFNKIKIKMSHKITLIRGDGSGPEIVEAAKKALEDKGLEPTEEDLMKAIGEEIESLERQINF